MNDYWVGGWGRWREEEEEKETGGKRRILRTEFWKQVEEKNNCENGWDLFKEVGDGRVGYFSVRVWVRKEIEIGKVKRGQRF